FTMELVEGQTFFEYVRTHPEPGSFQSGSHSPLSEAETWASTPRSEMGTRYSAQSEEPGPGGEAPFDDPRLPPAAAPADTPDLPRLRSALRQLAEGLTALHAAGKLHRDLKPGNILVDGDGRVVILDFGLVMDLEPDEAGDPITRIFGTPAYMAPEQASGGIVSEASDWYAVGVVLYEALTGRLPYQGGSSELIRQKLTEDPLRVDLLVPNLPPDLVQLCMGLLQRNPFWRPRGPEVLARLGQSAVPGPEQPQTLQRGREKELAQLLEAFQSLQDGQPRTLALHGSSGMGKSHLLRRFLREVHRRDPQAVLLTGRCYEQESVPYKALDSLVDALSNHLAHLPEAEVKALLPRNPQALTRLFPVLRQVSAFGGEDKGTVPDLLELRRRAFGALRELLARMGDQHPLILVIDDLQWGDLDSALLLEELLRPPDAPGLLLIFAFRSEEKDTSPVLREILPKYGAATLELGPMPPEEARDLALACMGTQDLAARAQALEIVREAQGNPFFIRQLAQFAQRQELSKATGGVEQVVLAGVKALPAEARKLLEVISVAGQPLELNLARRAAGLQGDSALVVLRAGHLVRTLGAYAGRQMEPYHDRIREAVLGTLAPDGLRAHHQALAETLEAHGWQDPEALARHFEGAGDRGRAATYAAQAGDRAAGALAFERAARYYQKALDLGAPLPQPLRVKLGEALANAGFGHRAGLAFLQAVAGAPPEEAMRLRRLAADRFIRSGRFEEGIPLLKELVKAVGLSWPATGLQALASLLFHRAQLKLRGLHFEAREADRIPASELLRMEVCRVAAGGFSTVDPMR
ncbi:MAG TPA: AAA family ATPase, partial [Holophagaceae bacterium]|nr:AAA family ATPase [Holophagaceae bacterium]